MVEEVAHARARRGVLDVHEGARYEQRARGGGAESGHDVEYSAAAAAAGVLERPEEGFGMTRRGDDVKRGVVLAQRVKDRAYEVAEQRGMVGTVALVVVVVVVVVAVVEGSVAVVLESPPAAAAAAAAKDADVDGDQHRVHHRIPRE